MAKLSKEWILAWGQNWRIPKAALDDLIKKTEELEKQKEVQE